MARHAETAQRGRVVDDDRDIGGHDPFENAGRETATSAASERAAVRELVKAARARGEELTGPDGLLKTITKTVLESALEEELGEHLVID